MRHLRLTWALAALGAPLLGASCTVATHYLPVDPERPEAGFEAACRVWQGRALIKGETLAGCIVPPAGRASEVDAGTGEAVAMISVRGWEAESKGGDQVGAETAEGGLSGERESEARTTGPGELELPVVGASGIVLASRDDDMGLEMGSVIRWLGFFAASVEWVGELAEVGLAKIRGDAAADLAEIESSTAAAP